MNSFDDSNDDSILELPLSVRIKSQINGNEEILTTNRIDESFESLPAISEAPIISRDKSNDTLTLDSDSDEEKIETNDVSNDSIEVIFCSPTIRKEEVDPNPNPFDLQINDDLSEDKPTESNTSIISFGSNGSTEWTPIKTKFINRTPVVLKTVRNRTFNSSLKKSINILNKKKSKEQKVIEKEDRIRERNERKAQKEEQKLKENAHKEVLKSRGIKNSKKYCFPLIDKNLFQLIKECLDQLFTENQYNYRLTESPLIPMSVTWIRKCLHLVEEQTSGQSSQMSSQTSIGDSEVQQNYILVVIDMNEFIERVNSYVTKSGETLYDFAKQVIENSGLKHITLCVLKLDQYFKRQKTKAQNQFRQRLNEMDSNQTNSTQNRRQFRRESMPSVTREDVDLALIDMEVKLLSFDSESNISVIRAKDYSEVSTYIYRYTRSVAESLTRNERKNQNIGWFAEADNRSTVDPIDASSHEKLWKRQLMQFPKISWEVGNAIASQYPTPKSLLEAYSVHSNPELLLADIVVPRRQPNGTNTERKVGPQMSSRIHLFMTSRDSDQLLNN